MKPEWELSFSSNCSFIKDQGYTCMVCGEMATGHVIVRNGPHNGRCLAVLCRRHSSQEGYEEFKARVVEWAGSGLIDLSTGGPGSDGSPEVWHGDHLDPMPASEHGGTW